MTNIELIQIEILNQIIREDSGQLELDYYDTGYDNQTEEMLGKVVVDTLDQDEVELDKYATEGTI